MTQLSTPVELKDTTAGLAAAFELVDFCSGHGQTHSPNAKRNARDYVPITWTEILDMIENPPQVDKAQGQWAIFSTLQSRVFERQRNEGTLYVAWSDLDKNAPGVSPAVVLAEQTINANVYAYSSRSATAEKPKCRLLYPLAEPIDGRRFELLQECINDRLELAGVTPDRVTERAAQLCYLPNRGELYEHEQLVGKGPLDWRAEFGEEIAAKERELAEEEAAFEKRRAEWEEKRKHREAQYSSGQVSPIQRFRDNFTAREAWESVGARMKGRRGLSPLSDSGSPAITFSDDGVLWHSHHGNDRQAGVGTPDRAGSGCWGDSFDVFAHFEHNGDFNAALKAAGDMFEVQPGVTINKHNQRLYMEEQERIRKATEAAQEFSSPAGEVDDSAAEEEPTGEEDAPFSLSAFSLTGMAQAMKAKMLEDTFVLENLAIAGQMTAFYAKPNAGKTLMTLRLLIDSIKRGDVKGENVFYINADDNYRGLVTKLELAERYGFHMLAPGHGGFDSAKFAEYLVQMTKEGIAQDTIIVLDTLKKFADLMDKQAASRFMNHVREFVSHGGTVIMLAHTNKHRDGDGKLVFAGTSDVVDDIDCAYMIDALDAGPADSTKTVIFENFKSRGDVADSVTYRYSTRKGQGYNALVESVEKVSDEEAQQAAQIAAINHRIEQNRDVIDVILEAMGDKREGVPKSVLLDATKEAGISRAKAQRIIKEHTGTNYLEGHRWRMEKGEKNAQMYSRLFSLDAAYKPSEQDYDVFEDWGDDE